MQFIITNILPLLQTYYFGLCHGTIWFDIMNEIWELNNDNVSEFAAIAFRLSIARPSDVELAVE